ncbi:MAG TPA: carboxypeptidase-like regulatory domain-containing protein, partial [Bryobacteraceae bacterium]
MRTGIRLAVVLSLAVLWFGSAGRAQTPTATITGIVADESGAVVPGARIVITDVNTGVRSEATSNETGNYVIANLRPGTYKVTAEKQGFSTAARSDVTLEVSQVARLDFSLRVGATSEQVEISARAPIIEASTASIGQTIENKAVTDLPLNGRNYLQLAKLSAGVLEAKQGDRAAQGGSFIANGVRAQL